MRQKSLVQPDQRPPDFERQVDIEALIHRRDAQPCAGDALRHRLRIVMFETVVIAGLVAGLTLASGQPAATTLRASILAGAACFAVGTFTLGLSAPAASGIARIRKGRRT